MDNNLNLDEITAQLSELETIRTRFDTAEHPAHVASLMNRGADLERQLLEQMPALVAELRAIQEAARWFDAREVLPASGAEVKIIFEDGAESRGYYAMEMWDTWDDANGRQVVKWQFFPEPQQETL